MKGEGERGALRSKERVPILMTPAISSETGDGRFAGMPAEPLLWYNKLIVPRAHCFDLVSVPVQKKSPTHAKSTTVKLYLYAGGLLKSIFFLAAPPHPTLKTKAFSRNWMPVYVHMSVRWSHVGHRYHP